MTVAGEPIGKLPPQDWIGAPETKALVAAFAAAGAALRFVGGCVRDSLAHRPVTDIDIATPERPERVMEILARAAIRTIPTGLGHGTVTAFIGARKFEITSLRADVETDGRHATVRFIDDWIEDAKRRDFTINALSCSPEGDVYDPFGGIEDLGHGRIVFVGRARDRIDEDVLRLLRYFRFYATYGRPPPDIEALNACRELAPRLADLSGERVREELFRILLGHMPAEIVALMRGERVLDFLFPGVRCDNLGRLRLVAWLESNAMKVGSVGPDPLRRLAALLATDAAGGETVADRLKLSNAGRKRLIAMTAPPAAVGIGKDEKAQHRWVFELGGETVRDLALLAWAGELAIAPRQPKAKADAWKNLLLLTEAWAPPRLPVDGDDVRGLGIPPGPEVGRLLRTVENWWKQGDFRAGREECLEKLKEIARRP